MHNDRQDPMFCCLFLGREESSSLDGVTLDYSVFDNQSMRSSVQVPNSRAGAIPSGHLLYAGRAVRNGALRTEGNSTGSTQPAHTQLVLVRHGQSEWKYTLERNVLI